MINFMGYNEEQLRAMVLAHIKNFNKQEFKMTREEAIKKFHELVYPESFNNISAHSWNRDREWAKKATAAYEALGMIKFDEPPYQKYLHVKDVNGMPQRIRIDTMIDELGMAGYKVVKS